VPVASTSTAETLQTAAGATGNGTAIDMTGVEVFSVAVSGTFVATVSFEGSLDGVTFFAVGLTPMAGGAAVTSATAAGQWYAAPVMALLQFRTRVSAYTSGSVTAISLKDYR
jgi:hypothetical protein